MYYENKHFMLKEVKHKKIKKGKKYMKNIIITKTNFNNLVDVGLESADIYFIMMIKIMFANMKKMIKLNF